MREYTIQDEVEVAIKAKVAYREDAWHIETVYLKHPQRPDLDITHCLTHDDREVLASNFATDRHCRVWREGEWWCDAFVFDATMVADWTREDGVVNQAVYLPSRKSPDISLYLYDRDYGRLAARVEDLGISDYGWPITEPWDADLRR